LDRLIRSRGWIGVVAFALIGIVAMQLWLLKLNGGIGRAIEHEGLLQRENAALSAENSSMSAGDLIEGQAVASGMRIVAPGSLVFLRSRGAMDERLAAARLARPVQRPTTGVASSAETASTAGAASTAEGASAAPVAESASGAAASTGRTSTAPPSTTPTSTAHPSTTPTPAVPTSTAPTSESVPTASTSESAPTAPEAGG